MIINKQFIRPGETKKIEVEIARLPSRSQVDISLIVSRAKKEGPVLLLLGGLHGDEVNGVEILKRFINQELHLVERGTVICIPLLNIYGFIHFSREVPDGKDINRSFPGNRNGSLASRIAYYLMHHIVPLIDYGIDFHTGGACRTNFPQVRCIVNGSDEGALARKFHAPFTVNSKYRPKSLRYAASRLGKEIIIYEGGESQRFDELAIQEGIAGTLRVMKHLGMVKHAPKPNYRNRLILESSWVRARYSGIHNVKVTYGAKVMKGTVLGVISDVLGEVIHTVKAPFTGYVMGLNNSPVIHQGDALFHLGVAG